MYSSGGNRHNKTCKQDVEEIEAYRASFGFSADEIITTQNYVEITDVLDDSFTMSPFPNTKSSPEHCPVTVFASGHQKMGSSPSVMLDPESPKMAYIVNGDSEAMGPCNPFAGEYSGLFSYANMFKTKTVLYRLFEFGTQGGYPSLF